MYQISYKCNNCGWTGNLNFNEGSKAPDVSGCPNCQCLTANKTWKQVTSTPFTEKVFNAHPC